MATKESEEPSGIFFLIVLVSLALAMLLYTGELPSDPTGFLSISFIIDFGRISAILLASAIIGILIAMVIDRIITRI